jgi:hypothetical protein
MSDNPNDKYAEGYRDGFNDGWESAKKTIENQLKKAVDYQPTEYKFEQGCSLCGIGKNGEPLGYACQHPLCPTRATY